MWIITICFSSPAFSDHIVLRTSWMPFISFHTNLILASKDVGPLSPQWRNSPNRFSPPFKGWKSMWCQSLFCSAFFYKRHVFLAIFLGTMISFGTYHHHQAFNRQVVVSLELSEKDSFRKTRGFCWEIFGAPGAWKCQGCVLRENKKGPNDQSSKGVGCWLLVFWGTGVWKETKRSFCRMEWEKKENRINYKNKDIIYNLEL